MPEQAFPPSHLGALPVQAPERAPETWAWSPRSETGRRVPRRSLDGDPIAGKLVKGEPAHDLGLGSLVFVSHDRGLPNDVDTSALVIEDDGLIREHEESNDTDRPQRP